MTTRPIAVHNLPDLSNSTAVGEKYSKIANLPVQAFLWETLTQTDTDGSPLLVLNEVVDITFFILVNGGTSVDVSIEGSFDGSVWFDLKDETGTVIAASASGSFSLSNLPPYVRPNVDGGTSVDVDVYAVVRFK